MSALALAPEPLRLHVLALGPLQMLALAREEHSEAEQRLSEQLCAVQVNLATQQAELDHYRARAGTLQEEQAAMEWYEWQNEKTDVKEEEGAEKEEEGAENHDEKWVVRPSSSIVAQPVPPCLPIPKPYPGEKKCVRLNLNGTPKPRGGQNRAFMFERWHGKGNAGQKNKERLGIIDVEREAKNWEKR